MWNFILCLFIIFQEILFNLGSYTRSSQSANDIEKCKALFMCPPFCMKTRAGCYVCDCGESMRHEMQKMINGMKNDYKPIFQMGSQMTLSGGKTQNGNNMQNGGMQIGRTQYGGSQYGGTQYGGMTQMKPGSYGNMVMPDTSSYSNLQQHKGVGSPYNNKESGYMISNYLEPNFKEFYRPFQGIIPGQCASIDYSCPPECWRTDVFTGCFKCQCNQSTLKTTPNAITTDGPASSFSPKLTKTESSTIQPMISTTDLDSTSVNPSSKSGQSTSTLLTTEATNFDQSTSTLQTILEQSTATVPTTKETNFDQSTSTLHTTEESFTESSGSVSEPTTFPVTTSVVNPRNLTETTENNTDVMNLNSTTGTLLNTSNESNLPTSATENNTTNTTMEAYPSIATTERTTISTLTVEANPTSPAMENTTILTIEPTVVPSTTKDHRLTGDDGVIGTGNTGSVSTTEVPMTSSSGKTICPPISIECPNECRMLDPLTFCFVCYCKQTKQEITTEQTTARSTSKQTRARTTSEEQTTTIKTTEKTQECKPLSRDCPGHCVTLDGNWCAKCTCTPDTRIANIATKNAPEGMKNFDATPRKSILEQVSNSPTHVNDTKICPPLASNCPENCADFDHVTFCPVCVCEYNPKMEKSKQDLESICQPVPAGCPEYCLVLDDNWCPVCFCNDSNSSSSKDLISTM